MPARLRAGTAQAALVFSILISREVAALAAPGAELPPAGRSASGLALGWEYDLSGEREEFLLPDPLPDASVTAKHPFYVRIRVPWARVEPEQERYDWSEVD